MRGRKILKQPVMSHLPQVCPLCVTGSKVGSVGSRVGEGGSAFYENDALTEKVSKCNGLYLETACLSLLTLFLLTKLLY